MPSPATSSTSTPSGLSNPPMPVPAKLAAAWTSFMFLYIYVDYFSLYKPGFLDQMRAGRVHEFDISVTFAVLGISLVGIPSLMVLLSMTLPARVNRVTNLVIPALYIPVSVYNASGESAWVPFYALTICVEVLILAFIMRTAWTWPRSGSHARSRTM